ncbi:chalcone isomerase family protein [Shewanella sp. 10N.286.54.B9]|uniref:chalcone isomerase family protein n=1 Tax=Shewanella sp. 10N.286.54.B9 TaxID=3229719 RepID=UPI003552CDCE
MGSSLLYRAVICIAAAISTHSMAQQGFDNPQLRTVGPTELQALSASSQFVAGNNTQVNVAADISALKEVGRGEMEWWWFTLYRARLLTVDGEYHQGRYPMVLEIEYYQEIPSERLLEATVDQWQHLQLDKKRQLQWQASLSELWPDVNEGDTLSLQVLSPKSSQFYFNGKPLEEPMPEGFSEDFLAIWLSTQTSRPELRKQLLGEIACDC